jgi:hypothetical protein
MTAFHTIAIPHDDILQGRLTTESKGNCSN